MNNKLTNKEEEFRDAADQISFDLDTSSLWDAIEPQLPPQKQRRRMPVWLFLMGLLVLGLLSSLFYIPNLTSYSQEIDINKTTATTKYTDKPATTKGGAIATAQQNNDSNIKNQQQINTNNIKSTPAQLQEKNNTHSLTPYSNYDDTHSNDLMNESNAPTTNPVQEDITIIRQPSAGDVQDNSKVSSENNDLTATKNVKYAETTSDVEYINQSISVATNPRVLVHIVPFLPVSDITPIQIKNQVNPSLTLQTIKPYHTNTFTSYYAMYMGVNKTTISNQIQVPNIEVSPDFHRETSLIGISSSFLYGKENKNGWRIMGGLSLNRQVVRYSNFDREVISGTQVGEASKTIDEDGNEVTTVGEVQVNTIINNDITWHRTHDYLNLTIGAGKRVMLTNRLSVVADINAAYNMWSRHEGYYFAENQPNITKFSANESHPYGNQGMLVGGSAGIDYDLGSFTIGIHTRFDQPIQSMTNSNNFYKTKNSQYGLQLGIVYRP